MKSNLKIVTFSIIFLISVLSLTVNCTDTTGHKAPREALYINNITAKQPIVGLVAMGSPVSILKGTDPLREVKIHPKVYSAVVINVFWKDLEPEKGVYDFSSIEKILKEIEKYNKEYPKNPLSAKLRIFGGQMAPNYVKKLNGGPVQVETIRGTVEIGLFWTEEYGDRFAMLLSELAKKYDTNPLIREVCVSTAASLTAEPFIAPLNKFSLPLLKEKGFTDEKFKQALRRALEDYKVWKFTAIDFPFSILTLTDEGRGFDKEFTVKLMQDFRETFGNRAVISNHGLNLPLTKAGELIYPAIKELGPPIAFQTVGPNVDFENVFNLGLEYGMTEFEVWDTKEAGGLADISYDTLKKWAEILQGKDL